MWSEYIPRYFLLDAVAASSYRIPNPGFIMQTGRVGLIADPRGGGRYMVAELQPVYRSGKATLLRFSSEAGEWDSKDVPFPLPPRLLSADGVVSHSGRLWWVDLSWCLITCDPFADAPVLRVVPLPPGKALKFGEAWETLDMFRCVRVSGGKLRFVDMYMNLDSDGGFQVSVWTLADPDSVEWTLECEATFTEIYQDQSFEATGLPWELPKIALIHPTNPDVVYFFLADHLVGVDVRARRVVECEAYPTVEPPKEYLSSRFVHAWQLPPALAGLLPKDADGGSDGEAASPASTVSCDSQALAEQ